MAQIMEALSALSFYKTCMLIAGFPVIYWKNLLLSDRKPWRYIDLPVSYLKKLP